MTTTADTAWRRYSKTTTAERACSCGVTTIMPGRRGWWFRRVAPSTPQRGSAASRHTESACASCAARLGLV